MKRITVLPFFILLFGIVTNSIFAQTYPVREDVKWARTVSSGTITLDGKLDEAAWAAADSVKLVWGQESGLPTSGWEFDPAENNFPDAPRPTIKFLVDSDNYLYISLNNPDNSIGGKGWPAYDGFLLSVKSHSDLNPDTKLPQAKEFFVTWWDTYEKGDVMPQARIVGRTPVYLDSLTEAQTGMFNAAAVIMGTVNDSNTVDTGYVFEMKINLDSLGYDVTKTGGDVVELNFSVWDADNVFDSNPADNVSGRIWWQSPWNGNNDNVGRVYADPAVTATSGPAPEVLPDILIPNANDLADPVVDGVLDEEAWAGAYTFQIAWNNDEIRAGYPGVGPSRSGQFQPDIYGKGKAPVLDPSMGEFKFFFKGSDLYFSAKVEDQVVQGTNQYDKFDGISLFIADRMRDTLNHKLNVRNLRIGFNENDTIGVYDYLTVDPSVAEYAVDYSKSDLTEFTNPDSGYVIEMKIDLTKLGYASDLGDKIIFLGADLFDGDVFEDSTSHYGTRTWWFRESAGGPALAWGYLDVDHSVGVEDGGLALVPNTIELNGNYPNPFNPSTKIRYSVPSAGSANIFIYNILGQKVAAFNRAVQTAGMDEFEFNARNLSSGIYFYQIILNSVTGQKFESKVGKMMLMK